SNLVVNGVRVDTLSFDVADDPNGIRLTHIDARLYKGEVTGSALLPVEKQETGKVNLNLDDVDIGALSKSLPKFPVPLEGRVTGTVKGEVTPATRNKPRGVTTQITLKEARQLRVRGIPAQQLH